MSSKKPFPDHSHNARQSGGVLALDENRPVYSLLRALHPYRKRLAVVVSIFLFKDSPIWLLPVITAAVIDVVVAGGPAPDVFWLGALASVLLLQVLPMHILFTRLYMGAIRSLGADLRNALTERLQLLSIGYHSRSSSSVMQTKVVRDVENIETMFSQVGNPALSAIFVFIGAVVMTTITVPQFLPIFGLTIPVGIIVWWSMRRQSRQRNEDFRKEMEHFSRRVGEMATLMPITRAHGLEHIAAERVSLGAEGVRERGLNLDMFNGKFGALSWVTMQILSVVCLTAAGVVSVTGWFPVSPGQVVLVGTYFTTLTGTVMTLLNMIPLVAKGGESARSLAEVLQDPDLELNEGKRELARVSGRITLERVTVCYDSDRRAAVDRFDLDILPGQTIAMVGASGSGKSTVMNAILGFVRPTGGRVLIDGVDMNELDLRTVRRSISVVPQDSVLFEGSIRDNVTYGLGNISDARVREVLVQANAFEIVESLPDGWDTLVGERGARLSGGQRQRISIARALIRDPRVLLLDEATSALDSESEAKVQEALERLMLGRTTIIVAHRLSTVMHADRIVVLGSGRILEAGTHEELIDANRSYAAMWGVQRS